MFVCSDLLLHITLRVYTDLNEYNYYHGTQRQFVGSISHILFVRRKLL